MTEQKKVRASVQVQLAQKEKELAQKEEELAQKTMQFWLHNYVNLKALHRVAFTEKDRQWAEEEKKHFFDEIGINEDKLLEIAIHAAGLYITRDLASTDQKREKIREEIRYFFKVIEDLITTVDKHKSIPTSDD